MIEMIEAAAKVNYENWADDWSKATEDRKMQSRKEVIKIFEAVKDSPVYRLQALEFFMNEAHFE